MTNPDFRALCQEAQADLTLLPRAEAALEQPAPEPPTDDEVATLIPWLLEAAVYAANKDKGWVAGKLTLAAQLLGERWGQGND